MGKWNGPAADKATSLEDLCERDARFGMGEAEVEIVDPELLEQLRQRSGLSGTLWRPASAEREEKADVRKGD